jgi:hypothetical protein
MTTGQWSRGQVAGVEAAALSMRMTAGSAAIAASIASISSTLTATTSRPSTSPSIRSSPSPMRGWL